MQTANLTVILANYNHSRYLSQSISAVLNQSVRPREFIILDDGSTDDSVTVIEQFAARDPVIQLLRNDRNRGVCATINRGIQEAKGEFILFCAADDYVLPGIIEKSVSYLERHPQAGLSCAYHSMVDGVSGVVNPNPSSWCTRPTYFTPNELADFIGVSDIPSTSAVYRRASVLRAGGYLSELRWSSDWFMNFVIAFRQGLCHLPEPLALIRVQPTSYGTQGLQDRAACRAVVTEILRHLTSPTYCDVLPHFQVSGVMTKFGRDLEAIALEELPVGGEGDPRLHASLFLGALRLREVIADMESRKLWRRARRVAGRCKRALSSLWRRSA